LRKSFLLVVLALAAVAAVAQTETPSIVTNDTDPVTYTVSWGAKHATVGSAAEARRLSAEWQTQPLAGIASGAPVIPANPKIVVEHKAAPSPSRAAGKYTNPYYREGIHAMLHPHGEPVGVIRFPDEPSYKVAYNCSAAGLTDVFIAEMYADAMAVEHDLDPVAVEQHVWPVMDYCLLYVLHNIDDGVEHVDPSVDFYPSEDDMIQAIKPHGQPNNNYMATPFEEGAEAGSVSVLIWTNIRDALAGGAVNMVTACVSGERVLHQKACRGEMIRITKVNGNATKESQ
jgi:hypothetical protein